MTRAIPRCTCASEVVGESCEATLVSLVLLLILYFRFTSLTFAEITTIFLVLSLQVQHQVARSQGLVTTMESSRAQSAATPAPTSRPSLVPHGSSSATSATTSSWYSVRLTLRRALKIMRIISLDSTGKLD